MPAASARVVLSGVVGKNNERQGELKGLQPQMIGLPRKGRRRIGKRPKEESEISERSHDIELVVGGLLHATEL